MIINNKDNTIDSTANNANNANNASYASNAGNADYASYAYNLFNGGSYFKFLSSGDNGSSLSPGELGVEYNYDGVNHTVIFYYRVDVYTVISNGGSPITLS